MVKGVNKQIVEINYTRDEYIEKAILIINPDKSKLPQSLLSQKADNYMQTLLPDLKAPEKPKKRRFWRNPYVWGAFLTTGLIIGLLAILGMLF